MSWIDQALAELTRALPCGYARGGQPASEPSAWAALALFAHDRRDEALTCCRWLSEIQYTDGSVGPTAEETSPGWFTGPAMLAWRVAEHTMGATGCASAVGGRGLHWQSQWHTTETPRRLAKPRAQDGSHWQSQWHMTEPPVSFKDNIARAAQWTLGIGGKPLEPTDTMGHDVTLVGWPWVASTHSWLEPTAFHVLALRAAGYGEHSRTREAVSLLVDRLLSDGGCNYGNTFVLGQELRPHVQPSGIAMLALAAGEPVLDPRIGFTLRYLADEVNDATTSASLSYALLGLAAHNYQLEHADKFLTAAARRTLNGDRSPYKLALLLAAEKRPHAIFAGLTTAEAAAS